MVDNIIEGMFLTNKPRLSIVHKIGTKLMDKYHFLAIECVKQNEIYVYEDGIYVEKGRAVIKRETEKMCGSFAGTNLVNEVIAKIERSKLIEREEMIKAPIEDVCINNGVLNLKTRVLTPHTPEKVFIRKLPVDYKIGAETSTFIDFLNESLYEKDIKIMQEWFGFCLWRKYHEKKALIMVGPRDTGKTVVLNTLENFLGTKNISTVDLHEMGGDKFAIERLYEKFANINDELTSDDLNSVDKFKRATGNSLLTAEPKFKTAFRFHNFSKLTFATNKMPTLKGTMEDPESYYSRWIVLDFDNIIEEKDKNKSLVDEINTKTEMSGILNWALDGLDRLMKNNGFSDDNNWEEVKHIMKTSGKSVFSFMANVVEKDREGFVDNGDLFNVYLQWCTLNSKEPENKAIFGRKFNPDFGKRVTDGKRNGYAGIKLNKVLLKL